MDESSMNTPEEDQMERRPISPMWEAMDCPDVTDDPFYQDFSEEDE